MPVLYGFLFGFVGSIPVAGPISVVVFTLGVAKQVKAGIAFSAGAALGEGLYACLALFGTAKALAQMPWLLRWAQGAGVIAVAAIGLHFLLRRAAAIDEDARPTRTAPGRAFLAGLGLALANPTLLFTWTAASATLASAGIGARVLVPEDAPLVALGAAFGITAWFATLLVLLARFTRHLRPSTLHRVERGAGVLLLCVAAWLLVKALKG